MNGHRVKQLRRAFRGSRRIFVGSDGVRRGDGFRRAKKSYNRPPLSRPTAQTQWFTEDTRDKTRFAHGKMKRAGIFATRLRT